MNPYLQSAFAILVVLLCMGLAGNDDFDNAQRAELMHKNMCQDSKKDFCKGVASK